MKKVIYGVIAVAAATVVLVGVAAGHAAVKETKEQEIMLSEIEEKIGNPETSGIRQGDVDEKNTQADTSPEAADTEKKDRKVAYVGDSILHSLEEYDLVKGKNQKVIAGIGLSPYTFYNNDIMDRVKDYKADRMFIMLGMNAIEDHPGKRQVRSALSFYKKIIKAFQKANPKQQIVVLPVTPVRKKADAENETIGKFNQKVKEMAEELKVLYFDYVPKMQDKNSFLKEEYADEDGEHWSIDGCRKFLELTEKYQEENL